MSQEPHVEFVKAVVSEQGKLPQINPEVLNRVGVGVCMCVCVFLSSLTICAQST